MKNWLIKYSLEIFSAVVILFVGVNILFFPELSYIRKLALGFAILAVMHEFEEKRVPGGFFELMAKKFGLPADTDTDLAGFFVVCYWSVLIVLAYLFDGIAAFLIMSVALGLFEAVVHTAGIWIHHMKKPYTPGLVSAWLMAALALYSIGYLKTLPGVSGTDFALGTILMAAGFAVLQRGTLYAAHLTYKDIRNKIKNNFSSK